MLGSPPKRQSTLREKQTLDVPPLLTASELRQCFMGTFDIEAMAQSLKQDELGLGGGEEEVFDHDWQYVLVVPNSVPDPNAKEDERQASVTFAKARTVYEECFKGEEVVEKGLSKQRERFSTELHEFLAAFRALPSASSTKKLRFQSFRFRQGVKDAKAPSSHFEREKDEQGGKKAQDGLAASAQIEPSQPPPQFDASKDATHGAPKPDPKDIKAGGSEDFSVSELLGLRPEEAANLISEGEQAVWEMGLSQKNARRQQAGGKEPKEKIPVAHARPTGDEDSSGGVTEPKEKVPLVATAEGGAAKRLAQSEYPFKPPTREAGPLRVSEVPEDSRLTKSERQASPRVHMQQETKNPGENAASKLKEVLFPSKEEAEEQPKLLEGLPRDPSADKEGTPGVPPTGDTNRNFRDLVARALLTKLTLHLLLDVKVVPSKDRQSVQRRFFDPVSLEPVSADLIPLREAFVEMALRNPGDKDLLEIVQLLEFAAEAFRGLPQDDISRFPSARDFLEWFDLGGRSACEEVRRASEMTSEKREFVRSVADLSEDVEASRQGKARERAGSVEKNAGEGKSKEEALRERFDTLIESGPDGNKPWGDEVTKAQWVEEARRVVEGRRRRREKMGRRGRRRERKKEEGDAQEKRKDAEAFKRYLRFRIAFPSMSIREAVEAVNKLKGQCGHLKHLWEQLGFQKPPEAYVPYSHDPRLRRCWRVHRADPVQEDAPPIMSTFNESSRLELLGQLVERQIAIPYLMQHGLAVAFFPLENVQKFASPRMVFSCNLDSRLWALVCEDERTVKKWRESTNSVQKFVLKAETPEGLKEWHSSGDQQRQLLDELKKAQPFPTSIKAREIAEKIDELPPQNLWGMICGFCQTLVLSLPVDDFRDYFGEKVAIYFAFVSFFVSNLVIAAIVGPPVFVIQWVNRLNLSSQLSLSGDVLNLAFGFFVVLWTTYRQMIRVAIGTFTVMTVVAAAGAVFYFTMLLRSRWAAEVRDAYEDFNEHGGPNPEQSVEAYQLKEQAVLVGTVLDSAAMAIFLNGGQFLSLYLTNWYNMKYKRTFEAVLAIEAFLIEFAVRFSPFFLTAFIKPDIAGCIEVSANFAHVTLKEPEDNPSCQDELQRQLFFAFLIQLSLNLFELAKPLGIHMYKELLNVRTFKKIRRKEVKAALQAGQEVPPLESVCVETQAKEGDEEKAQKGPMASLEFAASRQFSMAVYSDGKLDGAFLDYNELLQQFSYMSLFVVAFPLAPLLSLVYFLLEVKVDAFKIFNLVQRPSPESADSIGPWIFILQTLCAVAAAFNAALLAYVLMACDFLFPRRPPPGRGLFQQPWERHAVFTSLLLIFFVLMFVVMKIVHRVEQKDRIATRRTEKKLAEIQGGGLNFPKDDELAKQLEGKTLKLDGSAPIVSTRRFGLTQWVLESERKSERKRQEISDRIVAEERRHLGLRA
uniref:Anoctamin transmembrane domain-containing protein n=1 Tax=Chromera velia CCMP2878 TaxID=1169474 RepID=A0A0G4GND7_9ALVE|eukprot:Cvel_22655.t1-p1 / transcript=Cvel_22655.t1 / gene=Cvel_22655 / organism=Chromera_velia_CCMP2878 / gene_product=Anoctamin-6, putative / transcript_product=Anoctamin-6, putative / location=Cvel_scaffold2251:3293-18600(+) / protein_length=1435 / sequence_SO=supercontig / SO=protein_coding / is_pseudo=false